MNIGLVVAPILPLLYFLPLSTHHLYSHTLSHLLFTTIIPPFNHCGLLPLGFFFALTAPPADLGYLMVFGLNLYFHCCGSMESIHWCDVFFLVQSTSSVILPACLGEPRLLHRPVPLSECHPLVRIGFWVNLLDKILIYD